jgi:type IV fimbrial biogenesis protein FimT
MGWFYRIRMLGHQKGGNVLNTKPKSRSLGFSLIELMIGVVIMGLLLAVAAPNMRNWILNSQIRNAADSIVNGLQQARGEALARNTSVSFVLDNGNNTSWNVYVVGSDAAIASRSSSEGSESVVRDVHPAGATSVVFDNSGLPNAPGAGRISYINLDSTILTADQSNDLRVEIDFSGSVRMCDPNVSSSADVRHCAM